MQEVGPLQYRYPWKVIPQESRPPGRDLHSTSLPTRLVKTCAHKLVESDSASLPAALLAGKLRENALPQDKASAATVTSPTHPQPTLATKQ